MQINLIYEGIAIKRVFKLMWPYFEPYKVLLVIAVAASIITASTKEHLPLL